MLKWRQLAIMMKILKWPTRARNMGILISWRKWVTNLKTRMISWKREDNPWRWEQLVLTSNKQKSLIKTNYLLPTKLKRILLTKMVKAWTTQVEQLPTAIKTIKMITHAASLVKTFTSHTVNFPAKNNVIESCGSGTSLSKKQRVPPS